MKKKILFVINTMGRAGAETALLELLKVLLATGRYELSLFAIIPRGELFQRVPPGVRVLNAHPDTGSVHSPGGRAAILRTALKAFLHRGAGIRLIPYLVKNFRSQRKNARVQLDKLLWRLLSEGTHAFEEEYDLGVAYIEGAATYYLADKVRARRKAAFVHIDYERAGYLPMMDRDCYEQMERIFVVSNEVGEKFVAVHPECREKVRLFRNILDVAAIREKAEAEGFQDGYDGMRLLTVGRLTYQKGYDIAIEAMARVVADGYRARWYILGEGPERMALEKRVAELGLTDSFILLGARDNPYPFIRQCDLYVHATRFEGKSIAIEEAQALGKPILASDCTGNSEQIVSGVDGILFPLSAENLAERIEYLLDRPELRAELARGVSQKKLTHPEDLEQLLNLIEP